MQAVIDFFALIGSVITTAIDFIIGLVKDLFFVIQLLANMLANIDTYISFLPRAAAGTIVLIFTVAMIFKIAGRDG